MKRVLAAFVLFLALAGTAMAAGVVADGEKQFKKCRACHAIGEGAKNKVGPELNAVLGRPAAGLESYGKKYSKGMRKVGEDGLIWNEETLAEFLAKPRGYIKGTKMTFAGLRKAQDIENIVAYLMTFSPDYVPAESASN